MIPSLIYIYLYMYIHTHMQFFTIHKYISINIDDTINPLHGLGLKYHNLKPFDKNVAIAETYTHACCQKSIPLFQKKKQPDQIHRFTFWFALNFQSAIYIFIYRTKLLLEADHICRSPFLSWSDCYTIVWVWVWLLSAAYCYFFGNIFFYILHINTP